MEKCIGCELCAGVCPARCIYVRGADNPADDPVSPGRALRLRLRDQLPALHPLRPVRRGLPHRGHHRDEAVRVLLHQPRRTRSTPRTSWWSTTTACPSSCRGRTGARARTSTPRPGCGPPRRRATPHYEGRVAWSGELGYGVRDPEVGQAGDDDPSDPDPVVGPDWRRGARRTTTDPGGTDPMEAVVFIVCAVIVLAGALGVVLSRNPVHSALSLVATLFGIAVLFLAQDAQLLAAVQVIVYAGAIVVLFLFVIMLLGVDTAEDLATEPHRRPAHPGRHRRPRPARRRCSPSSSSAQNDVVTGTHSATAAISRRPVQHRPARPAALHHLHLRLRDHRRPAHHRRGRRRRAGPAARRRSSRIPEPESMTDDGRDVDDARADRRADEAGPLIASNLDARLPGASAPLLFTHRRGRACSIRRNPLVMFMCVELMLNAVNLTFVTFGRMLDDIGGQVIVFFVLVVAAAEVVVGLGIIVAVMRRRPGRHRRRHLGAEGIGHRRHGRSRLADPCAAAARLPAPAAVRPAPRRAVRRLAGHGHGRRRRSSSSVRRVHRAARPARPHLRRYTLFTWIPAGRLPRRRRLPARPAVDHHDPVHHRHRRADPPVLDRVHARRPEVLEVLPLPEPVRLLDADAGAGRQPAAHLPRLGGRRHLLLLPHLVLVREAGQRLGRQEGLRHQPRR